MSRLLKQLSTKTGEAHLDRGRQERREEGEAKVTLCQFNRRCGPLSEPPPPASKLCRWISSRPWLRRCPISTARQIWPCGWLSTLAERQELLGLQAVKALTANVVFGIRGRGHLVRRHSHLQEQVLEVVVVPPPGG